jgi:hypothetical protein
MSDADRYEQKMLRQDAEIDARQDEERYADGSNWTGGPAHISFGEEHYYDSEDEGDDTCSARWVSGGSDPYATECEDTQGHYPETDHIGPNPYGVGKVSWRGGGSCAGDALPYQKVQFHYPAPETGVNHSLYNG